MWKHWSLEKPHCGTAGRSMISGNISSRTVFCKTKQSGTASDSTRRAVEQLAVPWLSGKNQQWNVQGNGTIVDACGTCLGTKNTAPPGGNQPGGDKIQLWAKIQPQGGVAALVINNSPEHTSFDVNFAALNITSTTVSVRNIWELKDLGTANAKYSASVPAYDSAFLMLTPVS